MSFISFDPQPLLSRQQVAAEVYKVALARGLDQLAAVIALMAIAVEVGANGEYWCPSNPALPDSQGFPHDSESNDALSVGYLQQQTPWWGTTSDMMTLATAVNTFLDRLPDNYTTAAGDPVLAGQFAQHVQGSAYPDRYAQKWEEASALVAALPSPTPAPVTPPVEDPVSGTPAYNEFSIWSPSNQSREATKVDLFLIHTEEGGGGNAAAEDLANYLANPANEVSYHYTISEADDSGVTLVDVVDTDLAAWAVGDANDRSINLCFAGSSVSWSREQWLEQSNAIDVAAYIAVQDSVKYGFSTLVVPAPYTAGTPGISDHMYVTDILKWGTHTDVGPNFPWDIFSASVAKYAALVAPPAPVPVPAPVPAPVPVPLDPEQAFAAWLDTASSTDILKFIAMQLGPGDESWVSKGETLRDHLWPIDLKDGAL